MTDILCIRNNGYRWYEGKGVHFKGYLQTMNGDVIRNDTAITFLSSIETYESFQQVLETYIGVFLIIIEKEDEIWIATDIARSIPVYYTENLELISDDVDAIITNSNYKSAKYDDFRLFEMYTTSFVGFKNTVFKDIKQVELGSIVRIKNNSIEQKPYYVHGKVNLLTTSNYIERLCVATDHMIHRLLSVVDGRQIVLSLSGGYDSRYLACALKNNGVDNVICYTYGRADSFEVLQSKKVADALGYGWYNVTYDDNSVRELLNNDSIYIDYSNRPDYIVYLQNYLAVKTLHDDKIIPSNAVFITGLCNDMPTGFYIPTVEKVNKYGFSNEGLADYNVKDRFVKFTLNNKSFDFFKNDIIDFLKRMEIIVTDYESFIHALDCLETANFHSRCYLNMNVVHEFFGYEWLLPCWDKELLDFWYSVPAKERIGQKLYAEFITKHYAAPYGIGTKKHINLAASTPFRRRLKRRIGSVLVKIAYPLGIPMRRNTDINNMAILEVEIYKKIVQKKSIKSDRAALVLLLTIFIMERRYGIDWFERIKSFIA